MKKSIILAAATVVIAAAAAVAIHANRQADPIFEANIEALTNGEHGTGICHNTITREVGVCTLYCGSCTWMQDSKPTMFSGTGVC